MTKKEIQFRRMQLEASAFMSFDKHLYLGIKSWTDEMVEVEYTAHRQDIRRANIKWHAKELFKELSEEFGI